MGRYFLVRHGITDGIEQGVLQGITDGALSAVGRKQARLTGEAFKQIPLDRVFTSPLSRAADTARQICRVRELNPIMRDELKEMDFGWLEGRRNHWPLVRDHKVLVVGYLIMRIISAAFSGESLGHFRRRVQHGWEQIKQENDGGSCALVGHAGVLRAILTYEFGGPYLSVDRFSLNACSISEIEITSNGGARIIQLNDTSHLNEVVPG